jgi:hypothetical protein
LSPEGDAETLPSNLSPELLLGRRGRGEHLARASEEKGFTASSGAIEVVRQEGLSERGEGARSQAFGARGMTGARAKSVISRPLARPLRRSEERAPLPRGERS